MARIKGDFGRNGGRWIPFLDWIALMRMVWTFYA